MTCTKCFELKAVITSEKGYWMLVPLLRVLERSS